LSLGPVARPPMKAAKDTASDVFSVGLGSEGDLVCI